LTKEYYDGKLSNEFIYKTFNEEENQKPEEEEKKANEAKQNANFQSTDSKEAPKIGIIALQNKPLHYQCKNTS